MKPITQRLRAERKQFIVSNEPTDILVVEDNEGERVSIVAALQQAIPDVQVYSVHDGTEALDFLFARGAYTDRVDESPPTLVLLDLAMPGDNGFAVLGQIRSLERQDSLTLTPVVMFTDSQDNSDIKESYRCGANSYIIKPVNFPDFRAAVEKIGQYWMTYNQTST